MMLWTVLAAYLHRGNSPQLRLQVAVLEQLAVGWNCQSPKRQAAPEAQKHRELNGTPNFEQAIVFESAGSLR